MFTFSNDPYIAENQMRAIIQHLVAFAYIDADFDPQERRFIEDHIARLVGERARSLAGGQPVSGDILAKWTAHFHQVLGEVDERIRSYFNESVAHGETTQQFVLARLKLGCFELLKQFDEEGQRSILAAVEDLMRADGVIHPNETAFRDELLALVNASEEVDEIELLPVAAGEVLIGAPHRPRPSMLNHPFLSQHEWDFSRDANTFARQSQFDMELLEQTRKLLAKQRAAGQDQLRRAEKLHQFPAGSHFLDGHVFVHSPNETQDCELLVLGDLHGCYSCLKAALLQADFFAKYQAHADAPETHPPVYLVFLGDYIDRGRFSLSGTLRTALELFNKMPEHVFPLRGNHEYYVELDGKILAPVRPCEAMDSIARVAEQKVFQSYMTLFEALPNLLAFGDLLFVHGGIPRTDTLKERYRDLRSLNDSELRFQMMWSDPSDVDAVPTDLQQASARFPFGKRQFLQFMAQVGSRVMVRGHEVISEGYRTAYDEPEGKLLTLFSAGGAKNADLAPDSYYRKVTPMALTIRRRAGINTITPFEIDYQRYNDPELNAFFRAQLDESTARKP